jgi:hypothetical protein
VAALQFRNGQFLPFYWDLWTVEMRLQDGNASRGRHVCEASGFQLAVGSEEHPVARTNLPHRSSRDVTASIAFASSVEHVSSPAVSQLVRCALCELHSVVIELFFSFLLFYVTLD